MAPEAVTEKVTKRWEFGPITFLVVLILIFGAAAVVMYFEWSSNYVSKTFEVPSPGIYNVVKSGAVVLVDKDNDSAKVRGYLRVVVDGGEVHHILYIPDSCLNFEVLESGTCAPRTDLPEYRKPPPRP